MSTADDLPLVMWTIPCFDKRRERPFPVFNRTFVLDWSQLFPEQVEEVMRIVESDKPSPHSPEGLGTTIVTVSRSRDVPDWRMLKFRRFFQEQPLAEAERQLQDCSVRGHWVKMVDVNAEYFEDESGKAITHYEMIQYVSGQAEPIIPGDDESILRLALSPPTAIGEWDSTAANTISHFMEVVERICSSAWFRSPKTITFETTQTTPPLVVTKNSRLLEAIFPNDEETMAVLAYFRQLHAGDKLLSKAVERYSKHCTDSRKVWWVQERLLRIWTVGGFRSHTLSGHFDTSAHNPIVYVRCWHAALQIKRWCRCRAGRVHLKAWTRESSCDFQQLPNGFTLGRRSSLSRNSEGFSALVGEPFIGRAERQKINDLFKSYVTPKNDSGSSTDDE